ncbi:MAG: ABC transporter [Gammaproteobacteria bacterium]|nr:ABC transporter [Gammaproteobacteria bacterium]
MEINKKTRRQLRIEAWIFIILFLTVMVLLGWLANRYNKELDWTATGRNTLSSASVAVLDKLSGPVSITSYASGDETSPQNTRIRDLITRYQNASDKIHFKFVDPNLSPDQTRKLGIHTPGEMIVDYQGRTEHVTSFTEENLTNSLQRLLRNAERKIVFITGHGERNPEGHANFDFGQFFQSLQNKGFKVSTLNLTATLSIPTDTSVLVIASPQLDYLPSEIDAIKQYIAKGGNLWWMQEPDSNAHLALLANQLHIKFMNGIIVSAVRIYGVNSPTAIVAKYLPHTITNEFEYKTLYPEVAGIEFEQKDNWSITPFLESLPDVIAQGRTVLASWLKTGKSGGDLNYVSGIDVKGPIKFGIAMTRTAKPDSSQKSKTQRIVVMGDGDFISNTYLGLLGNQEMGEHILNWLTHDDNFINIPEPKAPGTHIVLTDTSMWMFGMLYLIILPLLLIIGGVAIWLRRRKR